ncbi:MAG: hypothetical protein K9G61_03550 [Bacteroidales bacterium]|nr:hypothetical protein [Bacteroidales bacterium]
MKHLFIFIMLASVLVLEAQEPRYQTYSTALTVAGTKNSSNVEWTNKDINVVLNYKTGDFKATINEADFRNSSQKQPEQGENIFDDGETFLLSGVFPISGLINQQSVTASYTTELQLTTQDESLFESIMFNMTVTKPGEGQANYRIFVLTGQLYKDEFDLPAFEGMDNDIEIRLFFNAFWQD